MVSSCDIRFRPPWKTESCESLWMYLLEYGTTDDVSKCMEGIRDLCINWDNTRMPGILEKYNVEKGSWEVYLEGTLVINGWFYYKWTCTLIPPNPNLNGTMKLEEIIERNLK